MNSRPIIQHRCALCQTGFESVHPRHLYCEPCSTSQDLKRKRLTAIQQNETRNRDVRRDRGKKISSLTAVSLMEMLRHVELQWSVRVRIPFSWSGSKNALYTLRRKGHIALRREASDYRWALILALKSALRGHKVVQNKLWIDIFVEKSNHKGDAANFVDTICDAVKVATGLDDRWFSIRRVDWAINKDDPQLMVAIGQEDVVDCQCCSYCGRILPFEKFNKNRTTKSGYCRVCVDCGTSKSTGVNQ